ncbi:19988_t:CDS:1, partial [Racocetra fulgida]
TLVSVPTGTMVDILNKSPCKESGSPIKLKGNEQCSSVVATATFNDGIIGLVNFFQDPCGRTFISGLFHKGFDPNSKYAFEIIDGCGAVVRNITDDLGIIIEEDGSTKSFIKKISNLNLNCDPSSVLSPSNSSCSNQNKRANPAYMSARRAT